MDSGKPVGVVTVTFNSAGVIEDSSFIHWIALSFAVQVSDAGAAWSGHDLEPARLTSSEAGI